ncbi:hypothetical protein MIND_00250700 [Mycena indigotica]|uniref:Transmembrane protein n=1 Tax=Mycena indigotica TaxID=2126181 RepID=A0A8H6WB90_9AGAR|nr:uncharacterized protein MIND_00250700 [Mycena indigotica]KAF7312374.1 hypothetical protein MIND_00250700 [Mycena indigotica]
MSWISLKSAYLKITFSPFSLGFFLFIFIHCLSEGFIQAFIYSQDTVASNLITSILHQAQVPRNILGILDAPYGNTSLSVCNSLDPSLKGDERLCALVFRKGQPNLPLPTKFDLAPYKDGVDVSLNGKPIHLSPMCTLVLTYPHQMLLNAQREGVVLILSQFWLFALSFFGIVYDSIPHLVAAICCRTLTTAWSMYILWRNSDNQYRFTMLLASDDSPCKPLLIDDMFPRYFIWRQILQNPDVALNIIGFALAIYLSSKLIKARFPYMVRRLSIASAHRQQLFASITTSWRFSFHSRYVPAGFFAFSFYKRFVWVSALLLISVVCLWLEQIVNHDNAISSLTLHRNLYIALSVFTLVYLVPWIALGWYAVRREWKHAMLAFLLLATIVLASWILMLKSWSFVWTFMNWPLFTVQFTGASVSLLSTIIFGVISYLHFDKGLAHYLYVDDQLAQAGFEPDLFEKDVEKGHDWREIGLDHLPPRTLQFSTVSNNSM